MSIDNIYIYIYIYRQSYIYSAKSLDHKLKLLQNQKLSNTLNLFLDTVSNNCKYDQYVISDHWNCCFYLYLSLKI